MVPTPVAENMVSSVREALQLLTSSVQLGDRFDPMVAENTIKISMHDVTETTVLPELLAQLHVRAPKLSLTSCSIPRSELAKELATGEVDLAIDVPAQTHPDLLHIPLYPTTYVCVVRPDHPYIGSDLSLDQYLALSHVHVSSRRNGSSYIDSALNKLGAKRHIQVRTQRYLIAPKLIRNTDLALTVPLQLAQKTDLKILPLPFEVEAPRWHLYWHRSADKDKLNSWLRELIQSLTFSG